MDPLSQRTHSQNWKVYCKKKNSMGKSVRSKIKVRIGTPTRASSSWMPTYARMCVHKRIAKHLSRKNFTEKTRARARSCFVSFSQLPLFDSRKCTSHACTKPTVNHVHARPIPSYLLHGCLRFFSFLFPSFSFPFQRKHRAVKREKYQSRVVDQLKKNGTSLDRTIQNHYAAGTKVSPIRCVIVCVLSLFVNDFIVPCTTLTSVMIML